MLSTPDRRLAAIVRICFLFFMLMICFQKLYAEKNNLHSDSSQDSLLLSALHSSIDPYGIPSEMYYYDDSLLVLKASIESNIHCDGCLFVLAGLTLIFFDLNWDDDFTFDFDGLPVSIGMIGVFAFGKGIIDFMDSLLFQGDKREEIPEDNAVKRYFDDHYGNYMDSLEKETLYEDQNYKE